MFMNPCLIFALSLAGAEVVVEDVCDADNIHFEGVKAFTPQSIRRAVFNDLGFLLVSHPKAPLDAFLKSLEERIRIGYASNGFPDAGINAKAEKNRRRIIVAVHEGQRFIKDRIIISGNTGDLNATDLIQILTSPRIEKKEEDGEEKEEESPPLWEKGTAAPFSRFSLDALRLGVLKALKELGYWKPEIELRVVRRDGGLGDLNIKFIKTDPGGFLNRIVVEGLKKNTREKLLKFLEIKEGQPYRPKNLMVLSRKLEGSGRFVDIRLNTAPAGGDRPGIDLTMKLKELNAAPPLLAKPSQEELILRKSARWLQTFTEQDGEIMVIVKDRRDGPNLVQVVFSKKGSLLRIKGDLSEVTKSDGKPLMEGRADLALFHDGRGIAASEFVSGMHFKLDEIGGATGLLRVRAQEGEKGQSVSLRISAGFHHRPQMEFNINIEQTAAVYLAYDNEKTRRELRGNTLYVERKGAGRLVVDSRTGRILSFKSVGEEDETYAEFRFGKGMLKKEVEAIKQARDGPPRVASGPNTVGTLMAAMLAIGWKSQGLPPEVGERIQELIRTRLTADWPPSDEEGTHKDFHIPSPPGQYKNAMALAIFNIGWKAINAMFPRRSWPWRLGREFILAYAGMNKYLLPTLRHLYDSEEIGPIGFLAIAHAMKLVNPRLAVPFVGKGLDELSNERFLADCRTLLHGESVTTETLWKAMGLLIELEEKDIRLIAAQLEKPEADLLVGIYMNLKKTKREAWDEALYGPLVKYWQASLKEIIQKELQSVLAPPKKEKK